MGNLEKLKRLKAMYEQMQDWGYNDSDISNELMNMSNGGFNIGEYGYATTFFSGEYVYILGGDIYKKVG